METATQKKSKWALLRNVVRAVALFKNHEANEAEDVNQLIGEIKAIPTDQAYRINRNRTRDSSAYSVAIKDLRRQQSIIRCVERGSPDDLQTIQLEIQQDPYRHLRDSSHPNALINKKNNEGQTPIYIACKHGNLEVVMLLLEQNVDYLILSTVDGEQESCLEVAVRWGHYRIAEELLKKKWNQSILGKAKKLCRSEEMRQLFKKKGKGGGKGFFGCFLCCSKKNKG